MFFLIRYIDGLSCSQIQQKHQIKSPTPVFTDIFFSRRNNRWTQQSFQHIVNWYIGPLVPILAPDPWGFAERGMLGGNLVSEAARPKHNDNISYNIVLIFANISNCPRAPWGFAQEREDGDLVSKTAAQYITPCCDRPTCCPIPKYIFHKVKNLRVSGFCYSCVWIIFCQLCITAL